MKFKEFIQNQKTDPFKKKEKFIHDCIKENICNFIKEQIKSIGKDISLNENNILIEYLNFSLKIDLKSENDQEYVYLKFLINNKFIESKINPNLFLKENANNYLKEVKEIIKKEISSLRKN